MPVAAYIFPSLIDDILGKGVDCGQVLGRLRLPANRQRLLEPPEGVHQPLHSDFIS